MKLLTLFCVFARALRDPGAERAYYSDNYDRGDSLDNVLDGLDSVLDRVDFCTEYSLSISIQP